MRIEGSSISCGVRRLVIDKDEKPTKENLVELIKHNSSCAIVITGVPTRRKDIIALLLGNGFERMKKTDRIYDPSVNQSFADMAFLVMYHDHEYELENAGDLFEQFVEATVKDNLADVATSIIHHGEYVGSLSFFIRYMNK